MTASELREKLTIEEVYELCEVLGGAPQMKDGYFISQTICHNHPGEGSHKLYYYDNSKLFKCFTSCDEVFDIFQLVIKVKELEGEKWGLPQALLYVASYFGINIGYKEFSKVKEELADWEVLKKYEKEENQKQIIEFKYYNDNVLKYLPKPEIKIWEQEGITKEAMKKHNICYNASNGSIIIPHYAINGRLIGIRERALTEEGEKNGKYRPSYIGGVLYNHPLAFSLYNLNNSKDNIKTFQKAVVLEGEKGALQYSSYFGEENDISVAVCGSSLTQYQVETLINCGAKEIIIAFDRQYKELNDEEHLRWCRKLKHIYAKYKNYVTISFMFDKEHRLGYKMSPTDAGPEVFIELFKERIFIDEI